MTKKKETKKPARPSKEKVKIKRKTRLRGSVTDIKKR